MKNKNIPKNIVQGLENYKSQIINSNILLKKSQDLISKISDNKTKINARQIHIKGIAIILKSVFDVIICSSLILEKDRCIDNQDCFDKILKVEKINVNWLPKMLKESKDCVHSENIHITQSIIKEQYKFLLEKCSSDAMLNLAELDFEEEKKLIIKLQLLINNISKLMISHKITLYNIPYFYTIKTEENFIETNIISV